MQFGKLVKYILKQIIMKCQKLSPLFAALTVGAKKHLIRIENTDQFDLLRIADGTSPSTAP